MRLHPLSHLSEVFSPPNDGSGVAVRPLLGLAAVSFGETWLRRRNHYLGLAATALSLIALAIKMEPHPKPIHTGASAAL